MNAKPELYINTISSNFIDIYPVPHSDYIPLAQLLSWMHSYKKKCYWRENMQVLFFKTFGVSDHKYQSEKELIAYFNKDAANKLYLDYPIKLCSTYKRGRLDSIIQREFYCTYCTQMRSGSTYISGWGLFGLPLPNNDINCVFCVAVHKDNIQNVINCILENKEIDNSLLEVWYNSKIRLRGSDYFKTIRTKLNNYIKLLESQGIKSVSMDKIPFFKIIELPKFKNLKEKQEFISDIYKKMLNLQNG